MNCDKWWKNYNIHSTLDPEQRHIGHKISIIEQCDSLQNAYAKHFELKEGVYKNIPYETNKKDFKRIICIDCEEIIQDDFIPIKKAIEKYLMEKREKEFIANVKHSLYLLEQEGFKEIKSDVIKWDGIK